MVSDDLVLHLVIGGLGQDLAGHQIRFFVVRTAINNLLAVSVADSRESGQLVFAREDFLTRWLHNFTVFATQKRLYPRGIPMVILPIRMGIQNVDEKANKALDWEDLYTRGDIPSSSAPRLAAIEKMFAEIETQFHGVRDRQDADVKRLEERIRHLEEGYEGHQERLREASVDRARYDERIKRLEGVR